MIAMMRRARIFGYDQAGTCESGLSAEKTFTAMKDVSGVRRRVAGGFWMLLSDFHSDALLGLAAFAMPVSLDLNASGRISARRTLRTEIQSFSLAR
jgi:hypothetical protein